MGEEAQKKGISQGVFMHLMHGGEGEAKTVTPKSERCGIKNREGKSGW